jgi:hypothetical protein
MRKGKYYKIPKQKRKGNAKSTHKRNGKVNPIPKLTAKPVETPTSAPNPEKNTPVPAPAFDENQQAPSNLPANCEEPKKFPFFNHRTISSETIALDYEDEEFEDE